jgi:tetratricopeptide (TPR) repeat protein
MIFAYDPFVGYFSGTLYDTVIEPGNALLTYRLGSLATLVWLVLHASCLGGPGRALRARFVLGALAGIASALLIAFGAKLGHWSTPESIAKDLGSEKHGARCDVVYPSTTREQEANLLVKDCDEEIAAVEKRLATRGPDRIRAFFFRDENDKKRLMGAAHTYIAKPWRHEVYLQLGGYPHPVLGHELAHVVAGSFGHGPFRVAGDGGGLVPNPGLIEGVAVMASPDDDDLTDAQWARAMKNIGILPPMEKIFSLGFLGDASAKSYTLAGAFMTWIAEKYGMDAVHRWYGGGDIGALTGKSWTALDDDFRAHLDTISLPAEAESFARAKFARPGIFGRKCPHEVDALRKEGDVCRDSQRFDQAIEKYEAALAKDALDHASRHGRANVLRRHRDREKGRAELEAIAAGEKTPRSWKDRADEALADADFLEGRYESAATRYDKLAAGSLDEDAARTLEVKALAARSEPARPAVAALLLGDAKHGPDIFVAGVALGTWETESASPLASYLAGRNMVQRGFFEQGAAALDRALADELPTPRLSRETIRQRAIAACALGDRETLAKMRARLEGPDDPFRGASGGRRSATIRMIERCAR